MAEVLAEHRHAPSAKFYCGSNARVEYAKCGCGVRMSPWEHDRHVAEVLAAAGFSGAEK